MLYIWKSDSSFNFCADLLLIFKSMLTKSFKMLFILNSGGQQGQKEQRADKTVNKADWVTVIISSVSVLQEDFVILKLTKIIQVIFLYFFLKVIFQGMGWVKKNYSIMLSKICVAESRIYIRKCISFLYLIKLRPQSW